MPHGAVTSDSYENMGRSSGAFNAAKELEGAPPELPTGPFQVIVADPTLSCESGNNPPYPMMDLKEIKAMPIRNIAADGLDSLAMDYKRIPVRRFDVVDAWGFEYRTLSTVGGPYGDRRVVARQDVTLPACDSRQAPIPARKSHHGARSRAA